jgi:flagellar biosynthesis GTPase FlhF
MTADELKDSLSALEVTDVSEEVWGDHVELARAAVSQTAELLSTALVDRITMDKGIAALARQKAEQQKAEDERLAEERAEQDKQAEMERQAEQERIDREKAEQLKAAQEAEAERQESLRPEKDKLMEWAKYLDGMTGPDVSDPQLKELRNQVEQIVCLAGSNLMKAIEAL